MVVKVGDAELRVVHRGGPIVFEPLTFVLDQIK